jgi:hypothetical protein
MEFHKLLRYSLISGSIAVLAACSSADTSAPATPNPTNPTGTLVTINGSVFASDVSGATVTFKKTDGTSVADPVTTNADGTYTVEILDTDLASDLVVESTGGGFVDEETSTNTTAGAMSAFVEGGTLVADDSVHVTPDTTIHANLIAVHGKTPAAAQTAFFNAFAHNADCTVDPIAADDPTVMTATDASIHAGWRAAVFSKLTANLSLTPDQQFDLFAAMAQDLADNDKLDDVNLYTNLGAVGINASGDILDQYITAAGDFMTASAANLTVTYTPLTMNNVHGKNTFKLLIEDNSGPVTGLTDLQVMPMMYMVDRTHSTPMGGIAELGNGEYEVTAYYLMPSRMMDGTTMGTWDLKVMTNMKTVHFYPNINMAMMSNTARVQLKGVADTIINMDGLEVPRNYNLFRDNLVQQGVGSNYEFDVFIAPMENMMSFPALLDPMTLTSGMGGTPYDVSGVVVEASDDGGTTWNAGVPAGTDGVWRFTGAEALTLNAGVANDVRVRLTVSAEVKTTNGLLDDDTNDFAIFTITP